MPASSLSRTMDWTVSAPTPRWRLIRRAISSEGARAGRVSMPLARRSSSRPPLSKGELVATSTAPSSSSSGSRLCLSRIRAGKRARSSLEGLAASRLM